MDQGGEEWAGRAEGAQQEKMKKGGSRKKARKRKKEGRRTRKDDQTLLLVKIGQKIQILIIVCLEKSKLPKLGTQNAQLMKKFLQKKSKQTSPAEE